jgi:hypothetical protein
MAWNMPDGYYRDRDADFEFKCPNELCPHVEENGEPFKWTCPGYVEGDTGAGVLHNEDGDSNDDPAGPVCGLCGHEGDNV